MSLYRSKQYDAASERFIEILRSDPKNATAAYYAAYSFFGAGKKPEAINMFWYLSKQCPQARETFSARTFLKTNDTNYVRDGADASIGVLPVLKQSAVQAPRINKAELKEQIIAQMIELTPRRSALDVTKSFVEDMRGALRSYPLNVLQFLHEHNVKMIISPNVIETDFRMQNLHPKGYDEGAKMDNVPALFNGRNIVIGQYHRDYKGDLVENEGVIGTVRHETGHAIDCYMGWISRKDEFKHEFALDGDSKNNAKLHYFCNSPTETFAELACKRLGGRTDNYRIEVCDLLNDTYPRCGKLVDQALGQIK